MGFRVKYIAEGAVYLAGGSAGGLQEGMHLSVQASGKSGPRLVSANDDFPIAAELCVVSVAANSAVTEVNGAKRPINAGDWAYLSVADSEAVLARTAPGAVPKRTFSTVSNLQAAPPPGYRIQPLGSDPSDTGHIRARVGLDYSGVSSHGSTIGSGSQLGLSVRTDITRIGGSYWNLQGYWRGRITHRTRPGEETLRDVLNKTYTMELDYDNPNSKWVAGVGRLYLPWANSLDTIDGGYFGRKLTRGVTAGLFLGSTPDPTSYSYAPNRQIGGAFVNFEGGSYDDLHYTSTSGGGLKMLKWSPNQPFLFFENSIFYKRVFSIYQASQVDSQPGYDYTNPDGTPGHQAGTGFGLGRSFITLRIQPHPRVEFSLNHTYFRDLPTFDPNLIQTGLLDKYLMQGFSAGTRVEIYKQIWLSADLGLSNRTGDKNNSLNQMFGITFGRLPWINMRADARYSRFNSSFGSGSYAALSLSKNLGEALQLQILAGQQDFASSLTSANLSRFVNGMIETALGEHYFLQAGGTINRGNQMNYDQWLFTFGYRFDNRHGHRGQ